MLILANHPHWTWRDLEDTPEDVLALLLHVERAAQRAAEENRR